MRPLRSLTIAMAVAALATGCVERKLFVRSDPIGAKVFLDGEPQGKTPLVVRFTYYGTREVTVRADGRGSARAMVDLEAPWYEWTPIDLVAELLVPWTIEDEHVVMFRFEGSPPPSRASVNELRQRALARKEAP